VLSKLIILKNTLSSISCLCKQFKTARRPNFATFDLTGALRHQLYSLFSSLLGTPQVAKSLSITTNLCLYLIQFTFNRRVSYKRYMNVLSHNNIRNKPVRRGSINLRNCENSLHCVNFDRIIFVVSRGPKHI
jgi:hypothetical protein